MPFCLVKKFKEFQASGWLSPFEDRGVRASGEASGLPLGGTSSQIGAQQRVGLEQSPLVLLSAEG